MRSDLSDAAVALSVLATASCRPWRRRGARLWRQRRARIAGSPRRSGAAARWHWAAAAGSLMTRQSGGRRRQEGRHSTLKMVSAMESRNTQDGGRGRHSRRHTQDGESVPEVMTPLHAQDGGPLALGKDGERCRGRTSPLRTASFHLNPTPIPAISPRCSPVWGRGWRVSGAGEGGGRRGRGCTSAAPRCVACRPKAERGFTPGNSDPFPNGSP